jgi:hypothetical protein
VAGECQSRSQGRGRSSALCRPLLRGADTPTRICRPRLGAGARRKCSHSAPVGPPPRPPRRPAGPRPRHAAPARVCRGCPPPGPPHAHPRPHGPGYGPARDRAPHPGHSGPAGQTIHGPDAPAPADLVSRHSPVAPGNDLAHRPPGPRRASLLSPSPSPVDCRGSSPSRAHAALGPAPAAQGTAADSTPELCKAAVRRVAGMPPPAQAPPCGSSGSPAMKIPLRRLVQM